MIMLVNFHIYDAKGNCLFSLKNENSDDSQLLYGFLYSLKSLNQKISPVIATNSNYFSYTTNVYQLFFMEMPTSVKFVLIITKDNVNSNENYKQILRDIYRHIYVEYHIKNPLRRVDSTVIDSQLFRSKINEYFSKF